MASFLERVFPGPALSRICPSARQCGASPSGSSRFGNAPTAEASAIRSAIYFDVAKSLIVGALASEDFVERNGDFGEGSCGMIVCAMIHMLFPGDGISGLAAAAAQRPDHFNTDLQGRLRLFWS